MFLSTCIFLSTPSARRATNPYHCSDMPLSISIHALREEGDPYHLEKQQAYAISIHALREEGDFDFILNCVVKIISIHALREEGDPQRATRYRVASYFYPRPPRGGRPV